MGSIKDRNGLNLTEAEDIKKRWQEYMEELLPALLRPHSHRSLDVGLLLSAATPDLWRGGSSSPQKNCTKKIFMTKIITMV